jgi:hypothetical protein
MGKGFFFFEQEEKKGGNYYLFRILFSFLKEKDQIFFLEKNSKFEP